MWFKNVINNVLIVINVINCVPVWLSGMSIASAVQKVVGSIPREHMY